MTYLVTASDLMYWARLSASGPVRSAGRALILRLVGMAMPGLDPWSDGCREEGERGGDPQRWRGVDAEFVVAAAQVLDECVSGR